MPKRSYPFGDVAPPQLKTRVRLRELSQGVMGERYRQEIFDQQQKLCHLPLTCLQQMAECSLPGNEVLERKHRWQAL